MGVGDLILITEGIVKQARGTGYYHEKGKFGPWYYFSLPDKPGLVDVPVKTPGFVNEEDWDHLFYSWFDQYTGHERYLIQADEIDYSAKKEIRNAVDTGSQCSAKVEVDFSGITLKTDCPERFHVLKFAYHSSWLADSDAKLYLVSPGFIGLIPGSEEVRLEFGQCIYWKLSYWISLITLISMVGYRIYLNTVKSRRMPQTKENHNSNGTVGKTTESQV
jgi:hypothetical protein